MVGRLEKKKFYISLRSKTGLLVLISPYTSLISYALKLRRCIL